MCFSHTRRARQTFWITSISRMVITIDLRFDVWFGALLAQSNAEPLFNGPLSVHYCETNKRQCTHTHTHTFHLDFQGCVYATINRYGLTNSSASSSTLNNVDAMRYEHCDRSLRTIENAFEHSVCIKIHFEMVCTQMGFHRVEIKREEKEAI